MLENLISTFTDQCGLRDDKALAADTSRGSGDGRERSFFHRELSHLDEFVPNILRDELVELSESDYWRRLWIIQEITVARSVGIVASATFLSIRDLYDMTRLSGVIMP